VAPGAIEVLFLPILQGIGVLIAAIFFTILVAGFVKKSRSLQRLGAVPLLLVGMLTLYGFYGDALIPLNWKARSYVKLPPEAQVITIEAGDWGGDGLVEFTLPPTRLPEQWIDAVWTMNTPMPYQNEHEYEERGDKSSTKYSRAVFDDYSSYIRQVVYNPRAETYYYKIYCD